MDSVRNLFTSPALFLAPMEGVTNPIFRQMICDLGGVDVVATEFVRITGEKQKVKPFTRHAGVPLQIQVMGTTPQVVGGCIRYLKDRGVLFNDDWLDLNVGCPSRRVNSSGAGAALLLEPDKLCSILEEMRKAHSGPLSMKTRVGYQNDLNFGELLSMLAGSPIDFLTLHARTKCDGYTGEVKLNYLRQAVEALPFPVVGNGDVWSVEDGRRMFDETGVAGIMCGRGVMRDPFLIKDISDSLSGVAHALNQELRREQLFSFVCKLIEQYKSQEPRENAWIGRVKEFLTWFSRNDLVGREVFSLVKRHKTHDQIQSTLIEYSTAA